MSPLVLADEAQRAHLRQLDAVGAQARISSAPHLADWRMTLARDLLLTQETTLDEVAARVGYSSVYAFATAFRRHHGEPPRRWQEHALAATPATDPSPWNPYLIRPPLSARTS